MVTIPDISLFRGCGEEELSAFINGSGCHTGRYHKGAVIVRQGEPVRSAGLVLSGQVKAFHITPGGAEWIQNVLHTGDVFGYILMVSENCASPVGITAMADTEVLHIPVQAILSWQGSCGDRIRTNLLHSLSARCWQLSEKIEYLSERTVRGRIASFLLQERARAGSDMFSLSVNRDELAQLLCVNRSALSRELSCMQRDGLLSFYRNSFQLKDLPALSAWMENGHA